MSKMIGGIRLPEENDIASPSALKRYAMDVDARLSNLDDELRLLEKPPCVIGTRSSNQGPNPVGDYEVIVQFNQTDIATHGGYVNYDLNFGYIPGIWHCGTSVDVAPSSTVTSYQVFLRLYDRRGARLQNTVIEEVDGMSSYVSGGAVSVNCSSIFEVHSPTYASLQAAYKLLGSGSSTILGNRTRIWAYRIRSL